MNEHPILFSTPMVKAILEGRKTQTRRVIKPQPKHGFLGFIRERLTYWFRHEPISIELKCPYGQPGDHLWIRETWQRCPECGRVVYRASSNQNGKVCPNCDEWLGTWKPSIHMFREYSRLTLEVVNVRVERVQDISAEDAWAEGCFSDKSIEVAGEWSIVTKFHHLWDTINEKRGFSWESNPWVWVVEFKRLH